jgi:hypothetical protein
MEGTSLYAPLFLIPEPKTFSAAATEIRYAALVPLTVVVERTE